MLKVLHLSLFPPLDEKRVHEQIDRAMLAMKLSLHRENNTNEDLQEEMFKLFNKTILSHKNAIATFGVEILFFFFFFAY